MLRGMSKTFRNHVEGEQYWHRREEHGSSALILFLCQKECGRTELALTNWHTLVVPDYLVAFSLECQIFFVNN